MVTHENVRVSVHYVAAGQPFQQEFPRSTTLSQVKQAALTAFALTEGADPSGNVVAYTLYDKKVPLENLAQTVGELAGHQHVLQLKLAQQITQGA